MFDGIDPGADCPLGSAGSVGVRGGLAAQRVGFVDQSVQFGLGELRRIDIIGQRKDAAGGARLDHVCSMVDVVAYGEPRLVGAVDHAIGDPRFAAEDPGA